MTGERRCSYDDFDVNAVGSINMLVAARNFCRESPFCFTSTNKVYGDHPSYPPIVELEKRYNYANGLDGVDDQMAIDGCLHSIFGTSKVAADTMCLGVRPLLPNAGGQPWSYMDIWAYVVLCAVHGRPYTVYGYKGKQVRDQIHARAVSHLFLHSSASHVAARSMIWEEAVKAASLFWKRIDLLAGYRLQYAYIGRVARMVRAVTHVLP